VAKAVLAAGLREPLDSTLRLADVVERALGGRRGAPRHPATRTFQALRMAVNGETEAIERGLEAGLGLLAVGGRMVVLTFHSIEDRLVKQTFVAHAGRWEALHQGGERWIGAAPAVAVLTRKPVAPNEAETADNPRARSAKLRVAERVSLPVEDSRKREWAKPGLPTADLTTPERRAGNRQEPGLQARIRHVAERFSGAA
jgi:16S rRNA (cytosine1402-N4)-methyltransferase